MDFENKKVLVVGMGKSGIAAVKALDHIGAQIYIQDDKEENDFEPTTLKFFREKIEKAYLGKNLTVQDKYDYLVLSPGVPLDKDFVVDCQRKGAEIIGELELAYQIGQGKYVAITGTNGKTTTTTLVGEIFKEAKKDARVVGNIGNPVVEEAITSTNETWFITEVSSFQLETIKDFRPEISAILNLTPDHLDRHKTMEDYGKAKGQIAKNQSENQVLVLNKEDSKSMKLGTASSATKVFFSKKPLDTQGVYIREKSIIVKDFKGEEHKIIDRDSLPMPGTHNLENVLAAIAISYFVGIEIPVIRTVIKRFKGVEHRVEVFAEHKGIKFVNDSKGTNPDATIKAIEAMKKNIVLIGGGYDKNGDFKELLEFGKDKIKALYLIGDTAEKIYKAAEKVGYPNINKCETLDQCVESAMEILEEGDCLLLSPACASWGMYKNFEERGKHFKKVVGRIISKN